MTSVILHRDDFTKYALSIGTWDALASCLPEGAEAVEVRPVVLPPVRPQSWYALRQALRRIAFYPVNGNSDPDRMAEAIEDIYRIARDTLQTTKEG